MSSNFVKNVHKLKKDEMMTETEEGEEISVVGRFGVQAEEDGPAFLAAMAHTAIEFSTGYEYATRLSIGEIKWDEIPQEIQDYIRKYDPWAIV